MKKFKTYTQDQPFLLPPSVDDLIPADHMVRVINNVLNGLDPAVFEKPFQGGGCPSYHPLMMLKVIVYAYSIGVYSSRNIAELFHRDIHFMYLSGMQQPDFNTVNRFRSKYFEDILSEVFSFVANFLIQEGYIKTKDYFVDGTKFEADANKYSHVWKKNAQKFSERVKERALEIIKEADEINIAEDQDYGSKDLPSSGDHSNLTSQDLLDAAEDLSHNLNEKLSPREKGKQQTRIKKVRKHAKKLQSYEDQLDILGDRNSFSKTDHDATFMRMKNDELKPGYNIQAGTQDSYVTGFSVSQNSNDATAFIDHMEKREKEQLPQIENVMADSVYGSEENYNYLKDKPIGNYLKYPSFRQQEKGTLPEWATDNFIECPEKNIVICPAGRELEFIENKDKKTHSGYKYNVDVYRSKSCDGCPLKDKCVKAKSGLRTIELNRTLRKYRAQVKENLESEKGLELRARRGPEVETPFGHIKHNRLYRRIRLRGIKKVETEMAWIFMAYNFTKMANAKSA